MKFSDLHLRVPLNDWEKTRRMIAKSSELGYGQVGVSFPLTVKQEVVDRLRQLCEEFRLDLVTRVDLLPRSSNELLGSLRRFRRQFEVVSVLCVSKLLARQAAKDRRVDLLSFPAVEPKKRFFDWAEAELASKSRASFEIDLAQVLSLESFSRVILLSRLRREVATAKSYHVPLVFSSGAIDPLLLRKPQDYASLALVFGVDVPFALEALSTIPAGVVERNRLKQDVGYVAPGIRVVKRKGNNSR